MSNVFTWGTGRRKSAIARVRVRPGSGLIQVNRMDYETYFDRLDDRVRVRQPLQATNCLTNYDVLATCHGGGKPGQAGAVVLGIARALKKVEPTLEPALREGGFLTRDPRMKERKKYGRRGARRSCQFSKR